MKSQRRKFPFRAFVLRDGVIGPGKHRPHGSSQPGLSLRARCAAAPRFAPLPPSYASMVSRLVRHVGVAQPGKAPPATCEEAALVVIEPPDLWNMWWLITEALTEYALLTAVLPAVLPRGMPVRVARVVDDKRKNAAGHSFFRALFASDGTDLNWVLEPPARAVCYRRLVLLPHENPWLLQNARHRTSGCFAPIMHGFAHRARTAFAIEDSGPPLPAPPLRRRPPSLSLSPTPPPQTWCWMFRSERTTRHGEKPGARQSASWAAKRVVRNQSGMLAELQASAPPWVQMQGLRFHHGGFSFAQQLRLVSGCTLLMGAHGAGLNLAALAMAHPIIVEVVESASFSNFNAPNLMSATGGCYHRAAILDAHKHAVRPSELLWHASEAAAQCARPDGVRMRTCELNDRGGRQCERLTLSTSG